jgi:hypothetical protein
MGASYVFEESELVREASAQYSPDKGQHMMAHNNKLNNISIFSFLNLNTTSLLNFESSTKWMDRFQQELVLQKLKKY